MTRKERILRERLEAAKYAVSRYSNGILSPLEIACKCDPKVLAFNWQRSVDIIESHLKKYDHPL